MNVKDIHLIAESTNPETDYAEFNRLCQELADSIGGDVGKVKDAVLSYRAQVFEVEIVQRGKVA